MAYNGTKWSVVERIAHVVYINVFISYLFVLECAGYAGETLYPARIAMSTGAF